MIYYTMLNLNGIGNPVCLIKDGKYNGKIVSVSDRRHDEDEKDDLIREFQQLKIPYNSSFQLLPSSKGRQIIYITGASGSGKTYFTRQFLEQYKKKHKDHDIYLFSSLKEDESLDKIKPKRINLETLVDDPMDIEEVRDSICVFDDIDVISDKKIREATYDILNKILEIGRHVRVSCIITNHLPTNGTVTRRILNESHSIVFFPQSSSAKIKYLLEDYVGLDRKQIRYMKTLNTRWVIINRHYPMSYISQHEVGLLNNLDD